LELAAVLTARLNRDESRRTEVVSVSDCDNREFPLCPLCGQPRARIEAISLTLAVTSSRLRPGSTACLNWPQPGTTCPNDTWFTSPLGRPIN